MAHTTSTDLIIDPMHKFLITELLDKGFVLISRRKDRIDDNNTLTRVWVFEFASYDATKDQIDYEAGVGVYCAPQNVGDCYLQIGKYASIIAEGINEKDGINNLCQMMFNAKPAHL